MLDEIKKHKNFFFCFLIWLFWAINEIYWLKIDNYPLIWDMSGHFVTSIFFFRTLREGIFAAPHIFSMNNYYPPLVPLIATPFYALFNISPDIGVAGVNLSFMAILISSIYYIGKRMFNQKTGVISAFIVSMFPIIFTYSRYFMLDIPLVAMVSSSICVLLFTEGFSNRKYSIFFGMTLGLGMLTKWTFIIFIIGPLVYYLYKSFKISNVVYKGIFLKIFNFRVTETTQSDEAVRIDREVLINFAISIILGVVMASPWYIPNISILDALRTNSINDIGAASYIIILIDDMLPLFFILSIILFANLLRSERPNSNMMLLLMWIVVPFLILSLQPNRQGRYIAPICPALALFSGAGIEKIKTRKFKQILIIFIICFGLLEFFSNSYEVNILPTYKIKVNLDVIPLFYYSEYNTPKADDWKTEEIAATLLNHSDQKVIRISVIPENPMIYNALWYYSIMNGLDFRIYNGGFNPVPVLQSDFVMTLKDRKGFWGLFKTQSGRMDYWSSLMYKKTNYLQDLFEQHIDNFTLIKTIDLPPAWDWGKSELLIYEPKERYQTFYGSSPSPKYRLTANISDDIQFLGYDINNIEGNKSKELELYGRKLNAFQISYYWRCLRKMDKNYTINVHFLDDKGNSIFDQNHLPCYGTFQTSKWKKGESIKEEYFINVPDVPPGNYRIQIDLLNPLEEEKVSTESNGINSLIIGNVTIERN